MYSQPLLTDYTLTQLEKQATKGKLFSEIGLYSSILQQVKGAYALLMCSYNTAMKLIFIGSSITIIYYMRFHPTVKQSYDAEHDSFKVVFIVAPCAILALLINQEFGFMEVSPPVPSCLYSALRVLQNTS